MKINFLSKKRFGFTLPEIMLVFAIIGIVMSIVIPTFNRNVQIDKTKIAWKKVYSSLEDVTSILLADSTGNFYGYFQDEEDIRDKYLEHLSYSRMCEWGQSIGNCWHNDTSWYYMNGTDPESMIHSGAVLNTGMYITFAFGDKTCEYWQDSIQRCGWIYVDTNGAGAPNMYGIDIFEAHIMKDGLLPLGSEGDGYVDCNATGSGRSCAAEFLYK